MCIMMAKRLLSAAAAEVSDDVRLQGGLAQLYAVVGRRISGDYGEALLLPAKQGKGEFRLKKADRAGDAVDWPGVI
jgi:hypothetical protein